MQQEQNKQAGRLRDQTATFSSIQDLYHLATPEKLYTGQSEYGRTRNCYLKRFNHNYDRPEWAVVCFRLNKEGHIISKFSSRKHIAHVVAAIVQQIQESMSTATQKAAKLVVY